MCACFVRVLVCADLCFAVRQAKFSASSFTKCFMQQIDNMLVRTLVEVIVSGKISGNRECS